MSTITLSQTASTITTQDGTGLYYKDWGSGPVVTFSHGWPLSADAWDGQMLFLAQTTRSGRPQSPAEASVTGVLRFARSARGRGTPLVAAGG
jgi:pimeloyl-ACP methyl ester carboxylesterase